MRFALVGLVVMLAACGSEDSTQTRTRTEAQRDSAIAESAIPGAAGVRSALKAADSAEARRAREDSILSAEDE